MATRRPQPYWQGELDGLCGIYSVINGLLWALHTLRSQRSTRARQVRPLTMGECHDLFSSLLVCMILHHETVQPAVDGLNSRDLAQLLRRGAHWLAERRAMRLSVVRPFHRRLRVPANELRKAMGDHLAKPGTAAIIGIDPPWHHWTVATSVSPTRLKLLDSSGEQFVSLRERRPRSADDVGLVRPPLVYLLTVGSLVRESRR